MPELSEKTIDKLNEKINFSKAFATIDSLYAANNRLLKPHSEAARL